MGYYIIFLVMALIMFGALDMFYRNNQYASWGLLISYPIVSLVLGCLVIFTGMFSEVADTEIWNGKVTGKEQETVSCKHSYDCNCRSVQSCSGSGKDRSCTSSTVCDTCYEHSHDYDWTVHTTIGNKEIDRVDRQGVIPPPRWMKVATNDPVADTHTFTNYLKAARNNVLNRQGTKISYSMPTYPDSIYDYYNVDRAVSADGAMPNLKEWSQEISKTLIDLGPAKQVNLVMVFTKNPQEYAEQLNAAWLGGKKNDVIVVIGTQDHLKADWVDVLSWTKREDFKVQLRDAIQSKDLVPAQQLQVIANAISTGFERRHMKEFEYLKYDIEPSTGFIIGAFVAFFIPLGIFFFALSKAGTGRSTYRGGFRRGGFR